MVQRFAGWLRTSYTKQQEYLFTHVETNLIIDEPLYCTYTLYVYLCVLCTFNM